MSDSGNVSKGLVFITGAAGYIGSVVVERAVAKGYTVHGLSRSDASDAKLRSLGAIPIRGDLKSLDILREESSKADIVFQLAYIHDFGMDYEEVLSIDAAAIDTMAEPLRGTNKPLVITSASLLASPDPQGGETDEDAPAATGWGPNLRIRSERHALEWSSKGVRVSALRLPPYVYGRGGSHFLPMLLQKAAELGESLYTGDGTLLTTTVHVDDAAELYFFAAEKAKPGSLFNGTASTTVSLKELATAVGEALDVPVRSTSREEVDTKWGPLLSGFVHSPNRASNKKAVEQLGWKPSGVDILTDTRVGSYKELAAKLRKH